jgi:hypothetical protein
VTVKPPKFIEGSGKKTSTIEGLYKAMDNGLTVKDYSKLPPLVRMISSMTMS